MLLKSITHRPIPKNQQAKISHLKTTLELGKYCMVDMKNTTNSFTLNTGEKQLNLRRSEVQWLAMIANMEGKI